MPRTAKNPKTAAQKEAERTKRFQKVAAKRVSQVIKKIRTLAACSNRASYSYSDADIKKMQDAINKEWEACILRFRTTPAATKSESEFSF